jgi:peptidoglycan/LPS O-acetylase OafA/YrhL
VNIGFRPGLDTWWPVGLFGVPFFSLVVPVFFLLSGYVAALWPPGPAESAKVWLGRRLSRLLPPFFVWNAILLATGVPGRGLSAPQICFYFFFGAGPLYYVGALVQLLALFAFVRKAREGGWGVLAAFFVLSVAFYAAADLATWTAGARAEIFETHLNRFFPAWGVFFAAGVLLGRGDRAFEWIERHRALFAVAAALSYMAYLGELHVVLSRFGFHPVRQFLLAGLPLQIAATLLFLAGLRKLDLSGRAKALLSRLAAAGPDTFGIYLSHVPAQSALFALWVAAGHDTADWWEVPILAVASWIVCQLAIRAARRLPVPRIGAILFGTGRPA